MAGLDANTKLLLHTDGQSGGKEIIDSGNTGHVVTQVGTAQLSTVQSKFGSTSCFFDGNSDVLTIPDSTDWDLTTNDFTIDCWVRFNSVAGNQAFYSRSTSGTSYTYFAKEGANFRFRDFNSPDNVDILRPFAFSTGTWYHVAVTRSGNDFRIFVDGIQQGATVVSANAMIDRSDIVEIGSMPQFSYYMNGYIDDFRFSNGTAHWTSNFTPPTQSHTSDANTKLLLHMDSHDVSGDGGSNTYKIPSFFGTAQIDTSDKIFGTGSLVLDGNSDYVSVPGNDPDFAFFSSTSNNYIFDFRAKFDVLGTDNFFMSQGNGGGVYSFYIRKLADDRLQFFYRSGVGDVNLITTYTVSDLNWHHYVYAIINNVLCIYVDGVQVGYANWSITQPTALFPFYIGAVSLGGSSPALFMPGNMDEIRIQNSNELDGQSLSPNVGLTDTFTVPTSAYTVVAPPPGTPPITGIDVDTKLMLHADNVTNGTELIDGADRGHYLDQIGTARHTTVEKKWGSTSLFFDGNSDYYLEMNDSGDASPINNGLAPFVYHMEAWIHPLSISTIHYFLAQAEGPGNAWALGVTSSGALRYEVRQGGPFTLVMESAPGLITPGQWFHVACIQVDTHIPAGIGGLYINGQQVAVEETLVNPNFKFDGLSIGSRGPFLQPFHGYMDDIRIQRHNPYNAQPNTGLTDTIPVPTGPHVPEANDKYLFSCDSHDVSALAGTGTFHIPEFFGTARTDTTEKVFGDSSFIFDGNSDYITFPDSSEFDMFADNSDDWILDFRVKLNGDYQDQYFINQVFNNDERWYFGNFQLGGAGTEVLQLAVRTGASFVILAESASGTGISDDNWHHVLICKKGSEYGFYLDGTQMFYINDSSIANINAPLQIGQNGFNTQYLDGRLDEFRIQCANDYSLNPNVGLTDSFTPPAQAYSYKPGKPINVVATTTSKTQIDLTWTPPNGLVQGYKIERESPIGGGFTTVVANTNDVSPSYSDTGLVPITHYNYRVTAIFDSVESDPSDEADEWTQRFIWSGTKLYCPWDVNFNDISTHARTFFPYWNLPSISSGFGTSKIGDGLLRIDSGLGDHDSIATNNTTDMNPWANTTDEYTISFRVQHRDTPGTAIREIYMRKNPTDEANGDWGIRYDSGGAIELYISINPSSVANRTSTGGHITTAGVDYDIVFYKGKNGLGAFYIDGVQVSHHTNVPIGIDRVGPFVIGTADGDDGDPGFKGRMDELIITKGNIYGAKPVVGLTDTIVQRGELVPSEPTTFSAIKFDQTQIDLSWSAPLCDFGNTITGYRIERESPTGGGFTVLVADTGNTNTTYSDTGLTPDTQYNYRVSAINSVGTCNFSNESSASTTLDEDGIRWNKIKAEHEHVDPTKDWNLDKFSAKHCKNYDKL